MYLIAVLRETVPHHEFFNFASRQNTKIPNDSQSLPESPVYCRPSGFQSIHRSLSPESATARLLDTLRTLTTEFFIESSQPSANATSSLRYTQTVEHPNESVQSLRNRIFAFQQAKDMDFDDMSERYTYEAIRLTSLVYAHALDKKIPFSKAAAELSKRPKYFPGSQNYTPFYHVDRSAPMPMQIKKAIMRTDTSYCWDYLAGVLFWVSLVAGAGANPGPLANEERFGDDEDARKFLTAISVRCCIVMSFEFGKSILETLKRLVAIERVLDGHKEPITVNEGIGTVPETVEKTFGPEEPPQMQKGFADFAQDFLSL